MIILPLKIKNLSYKIKNSFILKNIDILIKNENITIIAGNNGSGKSTFLKALHGLIDVPYDKITWNNVQLSKIKKYQSMVFQTPLLLNRSVLENLKYVASKRNIYNLKYVINILKKLNIEQISDINAKYISGGEKQKVAIAMAIIGDPKIIFLDEPTSQLDPAYKNDIENIINNLSKSGVKIFMTSHDISQIKRIGSEIVFMDNGEIIYHNSVKKFIGENHKNFIKNYITFG